MWPFKKKPKYRFVRDSRYNVAGEEWYYTEQWKGFPYCFYGYVSQSGSFDKDEAERKFENICKSDYPHTKTILREFD